MCVVLAAAKNFAYDKFLLSYNYSHGEFETIIELPMGEHEFKYLVDGKWVHDPNLVRTNYALLMHHSMYSKTPPKLKMQTCCNLPILRLFQLVNKLQQTLSNSSFRNKSKTLLQLVETTCSKLVDKQISLNRTINLQQVC